ncbi:DNA/RNA non-specific endonuclease [Pseudotenacibaculum sp. MALMAid0570]|uniref:DNA/RNA non-specific endonuclease n=1 Tax=Pseudotenacibaculum sp. MALMAid0570 TaxID=3143938 RepID=UPI0032E04160
MKSSSRNSFLVILVLLAITLVLYFSWESEEVPLDGSLTKSNIEEIDENSLEEVEFVAFDLPSNIGNQIVSRPFYTLSYNNKHEQADWVAYTLYPLDDSLRVKRRDNFRIDPLVEDGSATLKDYKGSGYDRGHLAPSKAMSYSKEAMNASFFMSNMSPQLPGFNRGIWKKLEAQVLDWSKESDSLYVVTGPVFNKPLGTIGENKVTIPRSYYKTIIRFKGDKMSGLAFLLDNKKSSASYFDFATSIDSIEKVTGIDFYHKMKPELQEKLEANKELLKFIN